MKIRTLIVDDEALARDRVREHLACTQDVEIVGECRSGQHAVEQIETLRPDLVFLDIQMPGFDGFQVIEAVGTDRMPVSIFVTAYDQFALRAFDVHALDYLLKPFDGERFERAMERARVQLRQRREGMLDQRLQQLLDEVQPAARYLDRMLIRKRSLNLVVRAADVDWIEAADNYVCLHVGGEKHLMRVTMNWMEERLDPERFLRIHRSILVNVDRIKQMESLFQGEYLFTLHDGTRLTSSRRYRDQLRRFFGYYG